jgi:aminobenzoyl-glutamate utilization protein B
MMAGVESRVTIQSGDWEMLVNLPGERLMEENLKWLGPVVFNEEEHAFARAIQKETGVEPKGLDTKLELIEEQKPEGGSSDVGDVSWVAPTLHLSVTTAAADAPWHAWPVVAASGMSIGHKGMLHAAKALAATAVDLYQDAEALQAVRSDFLEKTKGIVYKPYIPEGPPPLPKAD